jgi:hypothetical protein
MRLKNSLEGKMPTHESLTETLHGRYRDVLRDATGRVVWDRGWRDNTIVVDCRRLLAAFMRGAPASALGIQGLRVGAGLAAWDQPPGAPTPDPSVLAMADANPFTVPRTSLQFDFLSGAVVSASPTNRLQIKASLGPNVPPWPDANHASGTLREFGLVGELGGTPVLLNYVIHPAIAKDPSSTLERTIWLVF